MRKGLATIKEFSVWDYACLAAATLMQMQVDMPIIRPSVRHIIGTMIDAEIQLQHAYDDNGILKWGTTSQGQTKQ